MAFKLGGENRKYRTFDKPMVFKKKMDDGSLAQANMDGSIDVDPSVDLNSPLGRRIIKHEMAHQRQIDEGRAAYGDNWVMWEGKFYVRKEENGTPVIDGPNGRWPEGHPNHPWEAEAIQAEYE
tara:strand:+ start:167 stop:535 length:369 start_codon:yes stop_codon:yes gene_type:complete